MNFKFLSTLFLLISTQSFAFTIECLSEENLSVSRLGFDSLKIVSNSKGNQIIINDVATPLGETLPYAMHPLANPSLEAASFTVTKPIKFVDGFAFNAGSSLSYVHNKMSLRKYMDTTVTIIDFGNRVRIGLRCTMKKS